MCSYTFSVICFSDNVTNPNPPFSFPNPNPSIPFSMSIGTNSVLLGRPDGDDGDDDDDRMTSLCDCKQSFTSSREMICMSCTPSTSTSDDSIDDDDDR